MTSYTLPLTSGLRAQCLTVHAADRLTLLVEHRDGLYERLDVRLKGVELCFENWEPHLERCATRRSDIIPCDCGEAVDERNRAQAAREFVSTILPLACVSDGNLIEWLCDMLDHWPLRVELEYTGGEWEADVFWLGEATASMCDEAVPIEFDLTDELVAEGHAKATGDEQ